MVIKSLFDLLFGSIY